MKLQKIAYIVAAAVIMAGLGAMAWRQYVRKQRQLSRGDSVWRLSYDVSVSTRKPGVRLRISLPDDTRRCRAYREVIRRPGLKAEIVRRSMVPGRELSVVAPVAGDYRLTIDYDLLVSPKAKWTPMTLRGELSTELREHYLASRSGMKVDHPEVVALLKKFRSSRKLSKAELAFAIYEHFSSSLFILPDGDSDVSRVVMSGQASALGAARAMVTVCRAARIPARLVTGFQIVRGSSLRPHYWAEVLLDKRWIPFDPVNEISNNLPAHFLPVRRDGSTVVHTDLQSAAMQARFSVSRQTAPEGLMGGTERKPSDVFSLTRLPLSTQHALSLMLVLPFGALVTSVFRNIIGIQTFGTFTPALLAMSFIYADAVSGLIILLTVMSVGIGVRSLLDRLKLLMVPRLSVVLTLVVLCLVFAISVVHQVDFAPGPRAVILPMIILAIMIERCYIVLEEDGAGETIRLLIGTCVVAGFCFLLFLWKGLTQFVLVYPEVHLVTIGLLLLIGRYVGYRLTELWRFADLVENNSEEPDKDAP